VNWGAVSSDLIPPVGASVFVLERDQELTIRLRTYRAETLITDRIEAAIKVSPVDEVGFYVFHFCGQVIRS
jgi:hypothetical protein